MINIKSGDSQSIGSQAAKIMNKALKGKPEDSAATMARIMGQQQPQQQQPQTKQQRYNEEKEKENAEKAALDSGSDLDDSDDEELGSDPALLALREKRIAAMKKKFERIQEFKAMGHGSYNEIVEDQFLPSVTKSKYAICHFYHSDFERCKIMDKHLALLAPKYLPTRFIKLNAEKAPFFVGKLQVRTLPTVIMFKDGVATDRITGFDELGKTDEFKTHILEKRLQKSGVIVQIDDDGKEKLEDDELNNTKKNNNIRAGGRGAGDWDDEDNED